MAGFKLPDFNDRMGAAALAKQKALEQLRAKPPVDEAVAAARTAAREAKETADAERRVAKRAAEEEAKRLKREKAEAAAAAAAVPEPEKAPKLSDEEKKALRDAKYAARKNRKK